MLFDFYPKYSIISEVQVLIGKKMAGKIKQMIDEIIEHQSKGNPAMVHFAKTKLTLRGINPDKFDAFSEDDPVIIAKLTALSNELSGNYRNIISVLSTQTEINEIIDEIKSKLGNFQPKLILFFTTSNLCNIAELNSKLKNEYLESEIIGCTTAGEIFNGKLLKNSIALMAFDAATIGNVKVEIIKDLDNFENIRPTFAAFENHFNASMWDLDYKEYVGIILIDGLSCAVEKVMDSIGLHTNAIFIGGSAGDDLNFKQTHVYANGEIYSNAAVLALIKPKVGFDIIKTQSFCVTGKKLIATKVDQENREIIEFNDKPAALAYAEAINANVDKANEHFMDRPLGLMVGGEPYVRSPQRINGEKMDFYCSIPENAELTILKSTDLIKETKDALTTKISEFGNISALINFNCILRTLEIEQENLQDAHEEIFKNIPNIGFSTYGEEYIGHMNQTATMLIFK